MPAKKKVNPLVAHKQAYEAHLRAQEEMKKTNLDLQDSRRVLIEHLTEKLAEVEGMEDRLPDKSVKTDGTTGLILLPETEDPLAIMVQATESQYFKKLGREAEHPPLSIFHVNSWQGGPIACPNCGAEITRETAAPDGTLGRGG